MKITEKPRFTEQKTFARPEQTSPVEQQKDHFRPPAPTRGPSRKSMRVVPPEPPEARFGQHTKAQKDAMSAQRQGILNERVQANQRFLAEKNPELLRPQAIIDRHQILLDEASRLSPENPGIQRNLSLLKEMLAEIKSESGNKNINQNETAKRLRHLLQLTSGAKIFAKPSAEKIAVMEDAEKKLGASANAQSRLEARHKAAEELDLQSRKEAVKNVKNWKKNDH